MPNSEILINTRSTGAFNNHKVEFFAAEWDTLNNEFNWGYLPVGKITYENGTPNVQTELNINPSLTHWYDVKEAIKAAIEKAIK